MKKRGFTLIELLVVIAIIAILAAVLFPVFGKVRHKAQVTSEAHAMFNIAQAIKLYQNEFDEDQKQSFWFPEDTGDFAPLGGGGPLDEVAIGNLIVPKTCLNAYMAIIQDPALGPKALLSSYDKREPADDQGRRRVSYSIWPHYDSEGKIDGAEVLFVGDFELDEYAFLNELGQDGLLDPRWSRRMTVVAVSADTAEVWGEFTQTKLDQLFPGKG